MRTGTKLLCISWTLALTWAVAANAQSVSAGRTGMGLFEVVPLDPLNAVAVGANGTILGTIDAGLTWTPRVSGTTHTLFAVAFADDRVGAAVGELGTILKDIGRWPHLGAGSEPNNSSTAGSFFRRPEHHCRRGHIRDGAHRPRLHLRYHELQNKRSRSILDCWR